MIAGSERGLAARATFELTFSPNRMIGCVLIAAHIAMRRSVGFTGGLGSD
jgi:hypothetical protein